MASPEISVHQAQLLTFVVVQEGEMVFHYVQLHLVSASNQALSDQVEHDLEQRATPSVVVQINMKLLQETSMSKLPKARTCRFPSRLI